MSSPVLTYALWLIPILIQAVLALVMWRRKLAREFPVFFWYTVMHVVRAGVLLAVYRTLGYVSPEYFYSYWASEAVDAIFQVAVIYEIYCRLFGPYEALSHAGATLYRWSVVALLLIAIASARGFPGSENDALRASMLALHQATIVLTGGLLLLLFIFAASFGLTWRQYVFGIAVGLCLGNSVELAVTVVLSRWGAIASSASSLVHTAAYNCAVLVWAWSLLRREPVEHVSAPVPGAELDKWNEALAELLNR